MALTYTDLSFPQTPDKHLLVSSLRLCLIVQTGSGWALSTAGAGTRPARQGLKELTSFQLKERLWGDAGWECFLLKLFAPHLSEDTHCLLDCKLPENGNHALGTCFSSAESGTSRKSLINENFQHLLEVHWINIFKFYANRALTRIKLN